MTDSDKANLSRWAIILSGGNGNRMRALIEGWLGENRPKQYCAFVGTRTMLQHTVDRATAVIDPERIVTVIGPGHRAFLDHALRRALPGHVIEQPLDRGTAAGIFVAAAHIQKQDPQATVLILPSDQFVYPESRFLRHLTQACEQAERFDDQLILLGAIPNRPETDYGWLESAFRWQDCVWNNRDRNPISVKRFHEKPHKLLAERLLSHGCLWNTMVMAVKLQMLWTLGRRYLIEMMECFETHRRVLESFYKGWVPMEHEMEALTHTYQYMKQADFSRDVLEQAEGCCGVLPLEGIDWCDWGRPERVQETLDRHGTKPVFPRYPPSSERRVHSR